MKENKEEKFIIMMKVIGNKAIGNRNSRILSLFVSQSEVNFAGSVKNNQKYFAKESTIFSKPNYVKRKTTKVKMAIWKKCYLKILIGKKLLLFLIIAHFRYPYLLFSRKQIPTGNVLDSVMDATKVKLQN
ncbi:MAG: hypothetical protein QNJ47_01705 [Nostocaceae cyanobacterium]|nr:hypothetical protein [Nostocaceae cyanobacterium]